MNHKTLAIILAILLGGMAIYYNQATSDPENDNSNLTPPNATATK
jgi:hypothetical protein